MATSATGLLFSLLRIGGGVYVGLGILLLLTQKRYVYYPERVLEGDPSVAGMAYEDVTLRTADGVDLHAWYVPAAAEQPPVVLFCHGNAGNISHRLDSIRTFHDLGFSVLIFDYRGYGRSAGRPTEAGTYADAEAAWDWLTGEAGYAPARILLFGRSLGAAVALPLAARTPAPAALLIESAFTSARDMARRMFPLFPARIFCRFRYDNREAIARIICPVMIGHSVDDDIVPFAMGKALYRAAPEPKSFAALRGGHNSGGMDYDAGYHAAFLEFWNTLTHKEVP